MSRIRAMSALRSSLASQAKLWLNTSKMHVFDPQTGENLTRDEEAGAELTREANEERKADIARMRDHQA